MEVLKNQLNMSTEVCKHMYYSKLAYMLANPFHSSKTYRSLLKIFLNDKNIPCITLLFHENKFITNFQEKAKLFNYFFANQCTLLDNNSVLPDNLPLLTDKSLDSINFSINGIAKMTSHVYSSKAQSNDMFCIRMIELY